MRKSWLMCVLLGTLAWGQAAPSAPRPSGRSRPQARGGYVCFRSGRMRR